MSKREVTLLLNDMLEAANKIKKYRRISLETFQVFKT